MRGIEKRFGLPTLASALPLRQRRRAHKTGSPGCVFLRRVLSAIRPALHALLWSGPSDFGNDHSSLQWRAADSTARDVRCVSWLSTLYLLLRHVYLTNFPRNSSRAQRALSNTTWDPTASFGSIDPCNDTPPRSRFAGKSGGKTFPIRWVESRQSSEFSGTTI